MAQDKTPKPLTKEEQAQKIAQFIMQKRESIFIGALYNILNSGSLMNEEPKDVVKYAYDIADESLSLLYPVPEAEPEKKD